MDVITSQFYMEGLEILTVHNLAEQKQRKIILQSV